MTQKQKTHRIAVAALLAAVAAVLQFVEFSIPIMPAFVKLDISDLPALLGTFSLGPVYGAAIQLVKNLLHLPFGSSAGVGELSNFLLGATSPSSPVSSTRSISSAAVPCGALWPVPPPWLSSACP